MTSFFIKRGTQFLLMALIGLCIMNCTQRPPVEQSENHEIIGTVLTDLNQNPIELADLKGKTVFLNFWATWCKPCIAEMPSIENARKILAADSIVFLLASNESLDKIQKFKQKKSFDLNFVQLTSPLENLGIMAFPTTHIIAPSGETVFSEMGGREWDSEENLEMIRKINEEK